MILSSSSDQQNHSTHLYRISFPHREHCKSCFSPPTDPHHGVAHGYRSVPCIDQDSTLSCQYFTLQAVRDPPLLTTIEYRKCAASCQAVHNDHNNLLLKPLCCSQQWLNLNTPSAGCAAKSCSNTTQRHRAAMSHILTNRNKQPPSSKQMANQHAMAQLCLTASQHAIA